MPLLSLCAARRRCAGRARVRLLLASIALGGCARADDAPRAARTSDLEVAVRTGAIAAPDTVSAGWSRLRVAEDGAGHIVVLFRLADDARAVEPTRFVAALDTAAATPDGAVALGGPEVGDAGEVIVELTPGRYLLGCVRRGGDGHRHASAGEARVVVVAPAGDGTRAAPAPTATQEVRMGDFAYRGADRWTAGRHLLAVRNDGAQDHQLRLARLRPGATLQSWADAEAPGEEATDVAGVARVGAGRVAYLPVELPPGDYVAYCLVADPRSRQPHVALGMFRAIRVE